jgi:hypothetical protein
MHFLGADVGLAIRPVVTDSHTGSRDDAADEDRRRKEG